MNRQDAYAIAAAAGLGAIAAVEVVHLAIGRPWGTLPRGTSIGLSIFFATLTSAAAIALVLRSTMPRLETAAWMIGIFTPIALVAHGTGLWLVGERAGLFFVPIALAIGICTRRAFDLHKYDEARVAPGRYSDRPFARGMYFKPDDRALSPLRSRPGARRVHSRLSST